MQDLGWGAVDVKKWYGNDLCNKATIAAYQRDWTGTGPASVWVWLHAHEGAIRMAAERWSGRGGTFVTVNAELIFNFVQYLMPSG